MNIFKMSMLTLLKKKEKKVYAATLTDSESYRGEEED